jgi:hypothetical protein
MPVGDNIMPMRIAVAATVASFAFTVSARAEDILCPPERPMLDTFGKWTADYNGPLEEVWLSRQFMPDKEGAVIRCKRVIGSVEIMFQKRSCRIVPAGGKTEHTPYASAEEFSCKIPRSSLTDTNNKICMIVCN